MPKKPLQDNVEREQHDLKSAARIRQRVSECERLSPEVRAEVVALFTKGARMLEDNGYGVRYVNGDRSARNGANSR